MRQWFTQARRSESAEWESCSLEICEHMWRRDCSALEKEGGQDAVCGMQTGVHAFWEMEKSFSGLGVMHSGVVTKTDFEMFR